MPLNLLWAPFFVIIQLLMLILSALGISHARKISARIPSGVTTRVQKHLQRLIFEQVFHAATEDAPSSLHAYVVEALIRIETNGDLDAQTQQNLKNALTPLIDTSLQRYALTRTASADIGNTVISTATGAIALKQFTPGGLGIGLVLSAFYAKHHAVQGFLFGETLGSAYYALFPPSPSYEQIACITVGVLGTMAVIAAFAGLVIDPIQYYLGIHQKRLRTMIAQLEKDVTQQTGSRFNPKDAYIARIMDILDAVKTQL